MNENLAKKAKFALLVTSSGIGSRLGNLAQFTNKSLIIVDSKPGFRK